MQKTLTIDRKAISNNVFYSNKHWSVRKKLADEWHELVYWLCKEQKIPSFKKGVSITITSYAKRPLDPDNICGKIILDGLVHAQVIGDDTPEWVRSVTLKSRKATYDKIKVVIKL